MKKTPASITAMALLVAFTIPLSAQQLRYNLIDLGALGGAQSFFDPGSGNEIGGRATVVNTRGTIVGFADTPTPDPFQYICFWDCFVVHTFQSDSSGMLTDLGVLPGGGSSIPTWISNNGLIVGLSQNGGTDPLYPGLPQERAVLWQNGVITDLKTLPEGGYQSEANAVNSFGQVVGAALNTVPDPNSMQATTVNSQPGTFWLWGGLPYAYQTRAFLWEQETGMQDLGTLAGGTDAQAILINERGQVVGHSYIGQTPSPACAYPLATDSFIWEKRKGMVDLGTLGGTCTLAQDLNNRGQVVGAANLAGDQSQSAFLWEHGQIHALGGSLGGNFTGAFAISEGGQAVGFATLTGDISFHAVLWNRLGEMADLGVVGNDECSYATAINSRGQAVGSSVSVCDSDNANFRAFISQRGSMFDLNALIPAGSPLYLQFVEAINDRGEIAGTGVDATSNEHAFLLIPCDINGASDCEGPAAGAHSATEARPAPPVHRRQVANPRNSIRQMLRRRLGPGPHLLNPKAGFVGIPNESTNHDSGSQIDDFVAAHERAESSSLGSSCRSRSTTADGLFDDLKPQLAPAQTWGTCTASYWCSSEITSCHYCGDICPLMHAFETCWDLKYHRSCHRCA